MFFADYLSRMILPDGSTMSEEKQQTFLTMIRECDKSRDCFRMPHFDLIDYSRVPIQEVKVNDVQEIDMKPLGAPRAHCPVRTETALYPVNSVLLLPK